MRIKESNMEHYRNEFLNILKDGKFPTTKNGKATACCKTRCTECDFVADEGDCYAKFMLWLMEDYKEEITLTAREKHFVEFAETGWVARDEDGIVIWYLQKPDKGEYGWKCNCDYVTIESFLGDWFEFITWEDEEPWAVSKLRELKVKDE